LKQLEDILPSVFVFNCAFLADPGVFLPAGDSVTSNSTVFGSWPSSSRAWINKHEIN
jgi:hypothetical protein